MSAPSQPTNRRARRAAARETGSPVPVKRPETPPDIPLAMPDRSGPKGKTLYELAEERMVQLQKDPRFAQKSTSAEEKELLSRERQDFLVHDDDMVGPAAESLLWTVTFSIMHLTLDVLVYSQYRQEVVWSEIAWRTAKMAPMLYLVIYLMRTETASRFPLLKQIFFAGTGAAAGCYLVHSGNHHGYFAVMKRAPPVGALWVWSVVEMRLWFAVPSLAVVGGYMWWSGLEGF